MNILRFVLCSLILLSASITWAEEDTQIEPQQGDKAAEDLRAQVRTRIHQVRNQRLTEVLHLDPATASKLFAILDDHEAQKMKVQTAVRKSKNELRKALRSQADDTTIQRLIEQLEQHHERLYLIERELFKTTAPLLSTIQQGTLMLALPRMERRLRQTIE